MSADVPAAALQHWFASTRAYSAAQAEWFDAYSVGIDLMQATLAGPSAIAARAEQRLKSLLRHALTHSPVYRRHYEAHGVDLAHALAAPMAALPHLPTVNKALLMAAFDEWVTDPTCTRESLRRFFADPSAIGQPLPGQHAAWSSSGTSATPGWFVHDAHSVAITEALFAWRAGEAGRKMLAQRAMGARFALVAAIDGHFAAVSLWRRLQHWQSLQPWRTGEAEAFSALQPLPELCAALQAFAPRLLTGYPSVLAVLAEAQRRGHLKLDLLGVWSGGESLPAAERAAIGAAFNCPVVDDYGASEFPNLAWDCGHGALHVNADWVILEPVDEHGQPVPPGVASHTVLLTNLANLLQPLIRYDLGDSVTLLSQPCPCGSRLPALNVQGRRDDTLWLEGINGQQVPLLPLAITTVIEEGCDVWRFQLVQGAAGGSSRNDHDHDHDPMHEQSPAVAWPWPITRAITAAEVAGVKAVNAANQFVLRIEGDGPTRRAQWQQVADCFAAHCAHLGASAIHVQDDGLAPVLGERSGKLRRLCARDPLASAALGTAAVDTAAV